MYRDDPSKIGNVLCKKDFVLYILEGCCLYTTKMVLLIGEIFLYINKGFVVALVVLVDEKANFNVVSSTKTSDDEIHLEIRSFRFTQTNRIKYVHYGFFGPYRGKHGQTTNAATLEASLRRLGRLIKGILKNNSALRVRWGHT